MADKDLEFTDHLGDIDSIIHNQGISDLSWLVVDEPEYRAAEALPKQNLDMVSDLQKALKFDPEESVQRLIPLRPHTIVNTNPISQLNFKVQNNAVAHRVATYVMEGLPKSEIKNKLLLEFTPDDIHLAADDISKIFSESGLLGNVYVDAKHFPRCAQEDKQERRFLASCAKRSLYVLSKPECASCVKNINGRCASLKKQIVDNVPYNAKLAAHYSIQLSSENRSEPLLNDSLDWKEKLRMAFSLPINAKDPNGHVTFHTYKKETPSVVTESDIAQYVNRTQKFASVTISPEYKRFARRMMEGHDDRDQLSDSNDPTLTRLSSEYGLLGHTWLDMDALGGCKKTLAFIKEKSVKPDFILRRTAGCGVCNCNRDGACAYISKSSPIVHELPLFNEKILLSSLNRALSESRISEQDFQNAVSRLSDNLDTRTLTASVNLLKAKSSTTNPYSSSSLKAFYGSGTKNTYRVDEEEARRFIAHLMNTGLSGSSLQQAVLSRYTKEDLKSIPEVGRRLASEERIQGSYYIDPTAYTDYGSGCSEGSSIFKNRGPKAILASSSCTGCTLQTAPGWCSRYCKSIIRKVPNSVRAASKLTHLPVIQESVENPVQKYQLASEVSIDMNGSKSNDLDIELDTFSLGD